jgi:hypothetical protein
MESTELLALSLNGAARSLIAAEFSSHQGKRISIRGHGGTAETRGDRGGVAGRDPVGQMATAATVAEIFGDGVLRRSDAQHVTSSMPSPAGQSPPAGHGPVARPRWRAAGHRVLTDALTRRIVGGAEGDSGALAPDLGALALNSSPDFFLTARKRIALAFRLNVSLALALAFILLGGIVLSIGGALTGHGGLSVVFAGVSVADLLGVYAFKPLAEISSTVVASQRLEIIHMRLLNQLLSCAEQPDLEKRLCCQADVWNAIQRDLAAMSASAPKDA